MKKILIYSILYFVVESNILFAQDDNKSFSKIGSNLLGLILIEDYNVSFEKQISQNYSLVSTIHQINLYSNEYNTNKMDFRFTFGGRVYSSFSSLDDDSEQRPPLLMGRYIEFKASINSINNKDVRAIEFGFGRSKLFTNKLYTEFKLGLARFFYNEQDDTPNVKQFAISPIFSYGIGLRF